jgi:hypothetical protein
MHTVTSSVDEMSDQMNYYVRQELLLKDVDPLYNKIMTLANVKLINNCVSNPIATTWHILVKKHTNG